MTTIVDLGWILSGVVKSMESNQQNDESIDTGYFPCQLTSSLDPRHQCFLDHLVQEKAFRAVSD